jgi:hypothetical protein
MACITNRRGRWVLDFYEQHGKRRWKTLKGGITKKQGKDELRAIEEQISKGIYLPIEKTPSFSKVTRDWLEYKKPNIRITTWEILEVHTKISFQET